MADEQYELYQQGTAAALAEAQLAQLDSKADTDGYYAQLTAGAADNLTARGDAVNAEYLYRTAGGTADIESGQATIKSIHGNTLVWNQLVNHASTSSVTSGITFTNNGDGSWTVNGTAEARAYKYVHVLNNSNVTKLVVGHKYLYKGCPPDGSGDTFSLRDAYSGMGTDTGNGIIFTVTDPRITFEAAIRVESGVTVTNLVFRPQLFDLTQMFGAGNEPSTVAEFEALFPEPYYEYDAGSMLSVNMEGIETVGFNQWDEQWEAGDISGVSPSAGQVVPGSYLLSKNHIPVFPSTEYCISSVNEQGTSTRSYVVYFYDANKAFINFASCSSLVSTFTTPSNCYFIKFRNNKVSATYNNDICINLSWSGRRDGEYEQFWKSQRLIDVATYFPDGMRSAGSVYDELTSTEAITRVGVVDLGTLTWTYDSSYATPFFHAPLTGLNMAANSEDMKSALYTAKNGFWGSADNDMCVASGGTYLNVSNAAYTDAAAFKTAMSGVMLYYDLATPTVTSIDPVLNLSYRVEDWGTERIMATGEEVPQSAPPTLEVAYGLNAVDFIRRAPTQYVSVKTFQRYLLAKDAHDGTTTTMTWNDTDGCYDFAITDNATTEG